jgi:hypothetical protein
MVMNCCGEGTEKKEAIKDKEKSREERAGEGKGSADHGSHGGHGGCGMHGGGFMKWLWIGLLVYLAVSYIR